MDWSLPGSSVHENLQVRKLKWVAVRFNRESSQPRDRTGVSCIAGGFFTSWANPFGLCPGPPCAAEALTSSEDKGKLNHPVQPDRLPPWELLRGQWRMARATSTARGFLEGKSTLLTESGQEARQSGWNCPQLPVARIRPAWLPVFPSLFLLQPRLCWPLNNPPQPRASLRGNLRCSTGTPPPATPATPAHTCHTCHTCPHLSAAAQALAVQC